MGNNIQTETIRSWLFSGFTCLVFAAIILAEKAPALLSIAMIAQLLSILLFTHPRRLFSNFLKEKALVLFSVSYLFLLAGFLYSSNTDYLTERLQIKLPLLLYALAIPSTGPLSKRQKQLIFYSLLCLVAATSMGILANYALHYEEVNLLYLQSKIMPGPMNHIRYSLLVVLVICLCYYRLMKGATGKSRYALLAGMIFLIAFLHIYSVRSGLLCFYAVFALVLVRYTIRTRNFKATLAALGTVMLLGTISFLLSPTLKNKLINTRQDVDVYARNKDPNYNSLSTRMVSYRVAIDIFRTNVLFGCGAGDLWDENVKRFRSDYPSIVMPIIPHNQFIYYLAATGLIGMLLFSVSFTAPLWYRKGYRDELMMICYLVLMIAFQFEAMIETQLGVAITLLFIFIPYYLRMERSSGFEQVN